MMEAWNPSDSLRTAVERNPHKVAIVADEEWLSFGELDQRSEDYTLRLYHLGYGKHSKVRIHAELCAQFFVQIFAIYKIGAVPCVDEVDWECPDLALMASGLVKDFGYNSAHCDLVIEPYFGILALISGVTVVLPRQESAEDSRVLLDLIARYEVTSFFASPKVLRGLGAYAAQQGLKPASLRFIASTSVMTHLECLRDFESVLEPPQRLYSNWGIRGTLFLCSVSAREILQGLGSAIVSQRGFPLGRAFGDVGIRVRDGDLLFSSGGKWTYSGYLGDACEGAIFLKGRKAHCVSLPSGESYSSLVCEVLAGIHPSVRSSALVGARNRPVLCLEIERFADLDYRDLCRIERKVIELLKPSGVRTVVSHSEFQRLPNGEIDRMDLSRWAESKLKDY